jgi:hypothetical protein
MGSAEWKGDILAAASQLSWLEGLRINNTSIDPSTLRSAKPLPRLQTMNIMWCTVPDESMKLIVAAVPQLTSLWFYDSGSPDNDGLKQISRLQNLTAVGLNSSLITDEGMVHLAELKKLQRLYISGNISGEVIAKLQSTLPGCKITRHN